jgi:hypothetical protein
LYAVPAGVAVGVAEGKTIGVPGVGVLVGVGLPTGVAVGVAVGAGVAV